MKVRTRFDHLQLPQFLIIEILQLIFAFPAPLLLALLLNSMVSDKLKRTMQTIVYLPHFLSWVILISIWQQFFGGTGMLNDFLLSMGLDRVNIMANPDIFKPLVVAQGIWKEIGWGTIIFLAALTGPGRVWLQTLPLSNLAHALRPYLPSSGGETSRDVGAGAVIGGIVGSILDR